MLPNWLIKLNPRRRKKEAHYFNLTTALRLIFMVTMTSQNIKIILHVPAIKWMLRQELYYWKMSKTYERWSDKNIVFVTLCHYKFSGKNLIQSTVYSLNCLIYVVVFRVHALQEWIGSAYCSDIIYPISIPKCRKFFHFLPFLCLVQEYFRKNCSIWGNFQNATTAALRRTDFTIWEDVEIATTTTATATATTTP